MSKDAEDCGCRFILSCPAAMLGALPSGYEQDRAATNSIGQKHESHYPILVIYERIGHCPRMRDEEQAPGPKRDGLRTTLIPHRPGNLKVRRLKKRRLLQNVNTTSVISAILIPRTSLTSPTAAAVTSASFEPCGENEQPIRYLNSLFSPSVRRSDLRPGGWLK